MTRPAISTQTLASSARSVTWPSLARSPSASEMRSYERAGLSWGLNGDGAQVGQQVALAAGQPRDAILVIHLATFGCGPASYSAVRSMGRGGDGGSCSARCRLAYGLEKMVWLPIRRQTTWT
jgi:hypothetical protein